MFIDLKKNVKNFNEYNGSLKLMLAVSDWALGNYRRISLEF